MDGLEGDWTWAGGEAGCVRRLCPGELLGAMGGSETCFWVRVQCPGMRGGRTRGFLFLVRMCGDKRAASVRTECAARVWFGLAGPCLLPEDGLCWWVLEVWGRPSVALEPVWIMWEYECSLGLMGPSESALKALRPMSDVSRPSLGGLCTVAGVWCVVWVSRICIAYRSRRREKHAEVFS